MQILGRSYGSPQAIAIDPMILQQFYYYDDQGTVEPPPSSTAPTDQGSRLLYVFNTTLYNRLKSRLMG